MFSWKKQNESLPPTKRYCRKKNKTRGQGMVEFALAAPLLLFLIYGMLEVGRLLFIFASTVTAARQATRYGSATGDSPNGMPYYNDCEGIEAAVHGVEFINKFDSVTISYDGGLNDQGEPIPLASNPACGTFDNVVNGDRIVVTVTAQWVPIVRLLPLKPFTIRTQAERTIIAAVEISSDGAPGDFNDPTDGDPVLLSIDTDSDTYSYVNQTILYTYNLKNLGPGILITPTVVDNKISVDCGNITVADQGLFTCTGEYHITQANLDAGSFTNTASAGGSPTKITKVMNAVQSPAISLAKSGTPSATSKIGTTIAYTYTITNTGNVTLKTPFTVTDNQIPVNCSGAANIAPGASTTCNGTDQVTEADVDVGYMVNVASASVNFNTSAVTSNMATFTVLTPPILLAVTPPLIASAPGPQTYKFLLTNDTDYAASGVVISDTKVTIDPGCPAAISAHSSITCRGTYTFTQADLDSGKSIESTTHVTATMNSKTVSSNPVTVYVGISQAKALTASVVATQSDNSLDPGDTILYTYTLTNSGNVTLKTPISVTDSKGTAIGCADQSNFIPGTSRTCTGTYTIRTADITAGSVTTTGNATATFNSGTPETISASPLSTTTPTFQGPRFNLSVTGIPTYITSLNTPVEFTYTFTNTGSVNLYSPYAVTASLTPITLDCSLAAANIPPGGSTSCKGIYTVTSAGDKTNTISAATVTTNGVTIVDASNLPQSVTLTGFICSPSTVTLAFNNSSSTTKTWTIVNNSGATVHLATIHLGWPTNRRLQTLTFASPNTTIYSANPGDNSGAQTYTGTWTIASGATATVTAGFNNNTTVSDFTVTFSESNCSGIWSNP